jgi:hypothetical protein
MTSLADRAYRVGALVSRIVAAVFGGYALAALASVAVLARDYRKAATADRYMHASRRRRLRSGACTRPPCRLARLEPRRGYVQWSYDPDCRYRLLCALHTCADVCPLNQVKSLIAVWLFASHSDDASYFAQSRRCRSHDFAIAVSTAVMPATTPAELLARLGSESVAERFARGARGRMSRVLLWLCGHMGVPRNLGGCDNLKPDPWRHKRKQDHGMHPPLFEAVTSGDLITRSFQEVLLRFDGLLRRSSIDLAHAFAALRTGFGLPGVRSMLAKQAAVLIRAISADSESMRWELAAKDGRRCRKATAFGTQVADRLRTLQTSHELTPTSAVLESSQHVRNARTSRDEIRARPVSSTCTRRSQPARPSSQGAGRPRCPPTAWAFSGFQKK